VQKEDPTNEGGEVAIALATPRPRLATLPRGGSGMLRIPIEAAPVLAAPAWIDVDLDAIAHNVRAFRRLLPPACSLIAVVKGNAYGHGMVRVARHALQNGANELAVANVHEGACLRDAGIQAPILVAGPVAVTEAAAVVQHALVPSLGGVELAQALARASRRYLPVHIEVDTGMSRHGVAAALLPLFVDGVERRGRLSIAGVFTHFTGTMASDVDSMRAQLAAFAAAVDGVRSLRGVRRHLCNTLGTLLLPAAHGDAVRIGGGLYGFDPLAGASGLQLRPALALKARLVGVRDVPADTPVGYGATFRCARPSHLGLVPLGYGDGLVRELWNGGHVLVRGHRVPILGVVSMNQMVIDVTTVPDAGHGDEVVLLGSQGTATIRAEERVPAGGSVYEVTTLLRASLPRRYLASHGPCERGEFARATGLAASGG
jgi:alanine racemase